MRLFNNLIANVLQNMLMNLIGRVKKLATAIIVCALPFITVQKNFVAKEANSCTDKPF